MDDGMTDQKLPQLLEAWRAAERASAEARSALAAAKRAADAATEAAEAVAETARNAEATLVAAERARSIASKAGTRRGRGIRGGDQRARERDHRHG
jgi:hypothetical protein